MTGPSFAEVETSLAEAVKRYLLAEPNDRISEDENLRPVCMWLARWLRDRLSGEDGWGQYRSVDDILPCTVDRPSPTDIELRGMLVWMDDGDLYEPLFAKLHLSANPSMPLEYVVQVGDADRGLGHFPYGTKHDYPHVPVRRWLFTFTAPELTNAQNRYQLVVQIKPAISDDFNRLVSWEDAIIAHLATTAEVDGHDMGAGEFNIFIYTDDPSGTFRRIQGLPETRLLSASMMVAYRPIDGDEYVVLWPRDSARFNIA